MEIKYKSMKELLVAFFNRYKSKPMYFALDGYILITFASSLLLIIAVLW